MNEKQITNPVKAIRAKCLDCCCGSVTEVQLCPCADCSLYPFRFGKNPYIKRDYTEEQKNAMRERMEKLNRANKRRQLVEEQKPRNLPRVVIPPDPKSARIAVK